MARETRVFARRTFRDFKVRALSPLAKLIFVVLVVEEADDSGRFVFDPEQIRAIITASPTAEPSVAQVSVAMLELENGLAHFYEVEGRQYGQLNAFKKWNPKPAADRKPSKLPTPIHSAPDLFTESSQDHPQKNVHPHLCTHKEGARPGRESHEVSSLRSETERIVSSSPDGDSETMRSSPSRRHIPASPKSQRDLDAYALLRAVWAVFVDLGVDVGLDQRAWAARNKAGALAFVDSGKTAPEVTHVMRVAHVQGKKFYGGITRLDHLADKWAAIKRYETPREQSSRDATLRKVWGVD